MKIRTSQSHPLQIAMIQAGPQFGRVGITFCPGKKQANAFTGAWERDLGADLDVIREQGAAAVVTLIETHEIEALGVGELGNEVTRRHMAWFHLPIADVSVPGAKFKRAWEVHGPTLRWLLQNRFDVVVHCKGGLGRAGTITARLLVEFGWEPAKAIAAVREARPGAIETSGQEQYVLQLQRAGDPKPDLSPEDVLNRAKGALLGLAVGDAVGTTLEFKSRDSYPLLTDMIIKVNYSFTGIFYSTLSFIWRK